MGKNLIQQARGTGSPTYRAPSFRYKGEIKAHPYKDGIFNGKITDLIKCQGHSAPLAKIDFDDGVSVLMPAAEGMRVGDSVVHGKEAEIKTGNLVSLKNIPEGTLVYNVECQPGDGGKFVRASGTFARVKTKLQKKIIVVLPSKKTKEFDPECRACIGVIAGGGRPEKPFVKAGKRYHKMRARNKLYPLVSGAAMNAVDHPFGGSESSRKGRPTQASRNAPPGRKVGMIAPRRTGRKTGKLS